MPLPVPSPDLVAVLWGRAVRAISDALSAVPVEPLLPRRT
jgi:DNA-binding transcriptional regulator LsrR (DeoR family)